MLVAEARRAEPRQRLVSVQRRLFLAVGLVPSFWLLRRMPLGFFFMAGGWAMILSGLTLVPVAALSVRRSHLRRWVLVLTGLFILGAVLLAMMHLARSDARGDRPPFTDDQVRTGVFVIQTLLASWAGRAAVKNPLVGRQATRAVVVGYGLVIATIGMQFLFGDDVSGWLFVPAVALAAARFVEIPIFAQVRSDPPPLEGPAPRTATGTLLSFTWAVAVLAIECQLLNRTSGLAALIVAFILGLTLVAARLHAPASGRRRAIAVAVTAFLPILFWVTFLMPSLAGARYLADVGIRSPSGLRPVSSGYIDGQYERWYGTQLGEAEALSAISAAFRSPPVSAWPTADEHGVTGLLFGYRLEARYWTRGTIPPSTNTCRSTIENCVQIVVRRVTT